MGEEGVGVRWGGCVGDCDVSGLWSGRGMREGGCGLREGEEAIQHRGNEECTASLHLFLATR